MPTYETTANAEILWHSNAYELLDAANVLYRDSQARIGRQNPDGGLTTSVTRPMAMLYAFALEAVLKALLLSEGHRAASASGLHKAFGTHDVGGLYRRTRLKAMTAAEAKLADYLRTFVELGRYPVRRKPAPPITRNDVIPVVEVHRGAVALFAKIDAQLRRNAPHHAMLAGPERLSQLGLVR